MRSDGRAHDQMRPIKMTPDFITSAEGSVLIEIGNTRVICTDTVDDGVPSFLKGQGKGWVTGEYGMLPRATEQRTARESMRGRPSGRTLEIQRRIGRSLRAITDQKKLGERTVWLDCDVIQADGGTRTASITGAYVAMTLAMQRMVAANPPKPAETLVIYAVGLGAPDANVPIDAPAPVDPLALTSAAPQVSIGNFPAAVAFSGLVPGCIGLYQVNALLPDDLPPNATALGFTLVQSGESTSWQFPPE